MDRDIYQISAVSQYRGYMLIQGRGGGAHAREQGKGQSKQNDVQSVHAKARQEAFLGSELPIAKSIQEADAIDQLISCLEGSCG